MRRGTPSAELFGKCIFLIRTEHSHHSMRAIGRSMMQPPVCVSQAERGQRAVKENRLEALAYALNVDDVELKKLWWLCQGYRIKASGERVFYSDHTVLVSHIEQIMRSFLGSADFHLDIPVIEKDLPIIRRRSIAITDLNLEDLLKKLRSEERTLVEGYIHGLIDSRR